MTDEQKQRRNEASKRYYAEHKEQVLARQRKYREENLDDIRTYRKDHKDEDNARSRAYHAANRETRLAQQKAYAKQHPEVIARSHEKERQKPDYLQKANERCRRQAAAKRDLVNAICLHYGCCNPDCACMAAGYVGEELDFHHLRDKKFSVSHKMTGSKVKLAAEINKCVVLCANCHRRLHRGRFQVDDSMLCHVDEDLQVIMP